jgi:lauroyl/myristoyl acyltransferase
MESVDAHVAVEQHQDSSLPSWSSPEVTGKASVADIIKRDPPSPTRPLLALSDLPLTCWLAVSAATALLLPRSAAFSIGRFAADIASAMPVHGPLEARLRRALQADDHGVSRQVRRQLRYKFDNSIAFFRDRWHGDGRVVAVEGAGHIRQAQAGGRGVVLWIADMAAASDAAQRGLFEAGFPLSHMTRPEHGFSMSRLGMAWLNPFKRAYEQKWLARHIMYDRAKPTDALDAMAQTLQDGGILSVLATTYEGRTLAEADFLGGRAQVAAGPPRLALDAGCDILPVFVIADQDQPGHYRCIVQRPLAMTCADKKLAVREAAGDYLARLETVARKHPAAWRGWADLHYKN